MMSELTLLLDQPYSPDEGAEFDDMGSYNHSTVQANLAYLLKGLGRFSVSIELSLDSSALDTALYKVKDELIPDVCIYLKRDLSVPFDILKMNEMPLMVVEVLSPRQYVTSLLEKFHAYFALGIRSCWLVDPATHTVHIYATMTEWRTFGMDETLDDQTLAIQLPVAAIFE